MREDPGTVPVQPPSGGRPNRRGFVFPGSRSLRYRQISVGADPAKPSNAKRQADEALVIGYHEARLGDLLERVRMGFERYDSGELDAFELDELIHRYKRAARELWKFCGNRSHGRSAGFIARTLEEMHERDEAIDWWERGNPKRGRQEN